MFSNTTRFPCNDKTDNWVWQHLTLFLSNVLPRGCRAGYTVSIFYDFRLSKSSLSLSRCHSPFLSVSLPRSLQSLHQLGSARSPIFMVRAHRASGPRAALSFSRSPSPLSFLATVLPRTDVDASRGSRWETVVASAPWRTAVTQKARGWKRGWTTTWSSRTPTLSGRRQGKSGRTLSASWLFMWSLLNECEAFARSSTQLGLNFYAYAFTFYY